jgi:hypothetical protein
MKKKLIMSVLTALTVLNLLFAVNILTPTAQAGAVCNGDAQKCRQHCHASCTGTCTCQGVTSAMYCLCLCSDGSSSEQTCLEEPPPDE